MSNVVSLRSFRTLRECQKLFSGYETKLGQMTKEEIMSEFERYRVEAQRYPSHLLTVVKGQILMRMMRRRPISQELRHFVDSELERLEQTMSIRISDGK